MNVMDSFLNAYWYKCVTYLHTKFGGMEKISSRRSYPPDVQVPLLAVTYRLVTGYITPTAYRRTSVVTVAVMHDSNKLTIQFRLQLFWNKMVLFINVYVGQRVEVYWGYGIFRGTVMYKGCLATKHGDWVGIALDKPRELLSTKQKSV